VQARADPNKLQPVRGHCGSPRRRRVCASAAGDKRRRREVSGTADSRTSGEGPAFSVSVGVAGYPSDATTIGTLLYAADRALYEMKETSTGSLALSETMKVAAASPDLFPGA
jgi:GGDEF domain-containing protein